jgi:hypothetical protein
MSFILAQDSPDGESLGLGTDSGEIMQDGVGKCLLTQLSHQGTKKWIIDPISAVGLSPKGIIF